MQKRCFETIFVRKFNVDLNDFSVFRFQSTMRDGETIPDQTYSQLRLTCRSTKSQKLI